MARKNNKKNRRRAAFYGINKFDYEARKNLVKGYTPLAKTPIEKEKKVEPSPGNEQIEAWAPKITVVQTTSRKAQADVFEYFKGLETQTDLKDKMQ